MTLAHATKLASFIARPAALLALAALAGPVLADDAPDITAQRQEILNTMLTTAPADSIAAQRWVCAMGGEPSSVQESRASGDQFTPDASDSCVTALARTAHDGNLPQLYQKLMTQTGGTDSYETLPRAIGAAALSAKNEVSIGSDKAVPVTPSLAFDAGYTVAYLEKAANKGAMDPMKLSAVAQSCLSQQKDAGTCFSVGYVYGALAFNAAR